MAKMPYLYKKIWSWIRSEDMLNGKVNTNKTIATRSWKFRMKEEDMKEVINEFKKWGLIKRDKKSIIIR